MKKTVSIILCFLLVVMSACGASQTADTASENAAAGTSVSTDTAYAADAENPSDPAEATDSAEEKEDYSKSWRERPIPESFDLRSVDTDGDGDGDRCFVTPVRFQNPFGTCWGFAAIAAAEISILGSILDSEPNAWKTLDLSEKQLAYFTHVPLDDPDNPQNGEGNTPDDITDAMQVYNAGGSIFLATSTFGQGIGPSDENNDAYGDFFTYRGANHYAEHRYLDGEYRSYCYSLEDDWTIPEEYRFKQDYVLLDSYLLPSPAETGLTGSYVYYEEATRLIKEQLLDKRGVMIGFCADTSLPTQDSTEGFYIDLNNWAHYTWNDAATPNHAVTIVGWDDNYPKENFLSDHTPPYDGAWLVKNSWGSGELDFPAAGNRHWGIEVPETDADGNPVLDENGEPVMVGSGYFWLSYYDKSLNNPEAFEFEVALDPEQIAQYDYLSASDISVAPQISLTRMANVFTAKNAQLLEKISCVTGSMNTEVGYAVYLLGDDSAAPDQGYLAVSGTVTYEYAGFHKIVLPEDVFIQSGQRYSVIMTVKEDGYYDVNMPVASMLKGFITQKAVINPGESFVFDEESGWQDYRDIAEELLEDNPYADFGGEMYYDNFPIKAYGHIVAGNVSIVLSADRTTLSLKEGNNSTDIGLSFRGNAGLPIGNPEISWTLLPGSEKILDLKADETGTFASVTAKKNGTAYVAVSVYGIGTSILKLEVSHPVPKSILPVHTIMEYTGEALTTECLVLDAGNVKLVENEDYTMKFSSNEKCGIAEIEFCDPEGNPFDPELTAYFGIKPQKAEITSVRASDGSIQIVVKDQWESGITGYEIEYSPAGQDSWTAVRLTEGNERTIKDLAEGSYDVRVRAYVDTSEAEKDVYNANIYYGSYSGIETVSW